LRLLDFLRGTKDERLLASALLPTLQALLAFIDYRESWALAGNRALTGHPCFSRSCFPLLTNIRTIWVNALELYATR
jgi:hypothetical protein